ncbi:asparaginase domain-containing protein [Flavicella sp.]|uniref:asparaginase domain-containing protein n=1 Tax=Flavicella sp. TaxID=2957742 RepID=UPI003018A391
MSTISLFVTGGTLDKQYNEISGELSYSSTSVYDIIKDSRTTLNIEIKKLMLVDSLEMSQTERKLVVTNCIASKNDTIIITHGTDTMIETARDIAFENIQKTIILTGAMIPYKVQKSDSVFNLATALSFVQTLKFGVYIVMNGHYFLWNDVRKNKKLGVFENL